jgi:hypothetical protein
MALSPSAAANRRFGFQIKPEITPPPIPTNPGTAPEMAELDITGDAFHPEWNYTIKPRCRQIA